MSSKTAFQAITYRRKLVTLPSEPDVYDFLEAVAETSESCPDVALFASGDFHAAAARTYSGAEVWRWEWVAGKDGARTAAADTWNENVDPEDDREVTVHTVDEEHMDAYIDYWREDLEREFAEGIEEMQQDVKERADADAYDAEQQKRAAAQHV